MNNTDNRKTLSCSMQRGMEQLKRTGDNDFRPVLFLQAIDTILKNVGDQLHEKTVYNLNRLYVEVMYKNNTVCNTPSSLNFVYGRNQCDSPIYIPYTANQGPTISDPPILELDDL